MFETGGILLGASSSPGPIDSDRRKLDPSMTSLYQLHKDCSSYIFFPLVFHVCMNIHIYLYILTFLYLSLFLIWLLRDYFQVYCR